jgi:hypothetical protein
MLARRFLTFAALLMALFYSAQGAVLHAYSENDDAAYRAALSALIGQPVDYFDTRGGTPTLAQLSAYSAVMTWANYSHADRVALGDVLADYVDAGGRVILSAFSTYTSGNSLGGRIMTSGYSPVASPGGSNHFSSSSYAGDGTLFYTGVGSLDFTYRDYLAVQGGGLVDGHYGDGEILVAYRPDYAVFYMNGTAHGVLGGTGDWVPLEANLILSNAIPEPATVVLLGAGLLALGLLARSRVSRA